MTYIFKNLNARTATFEDFRKEYQKQFGIDCFDGMDEEDIPTGLIREENNDFIHAYVGKDHVELWEDDGDYKKEVEIE